MFFNYFRKVIVITDIFCVYAQHTSKDVLLSSETDNAFTDSLAQTGRELWPITTSKATIVKESLISLQFRKRNITLPRVDFSNC